MDPSELPLIEIAGEDESLLHSIPTDTTAFTNDSDRSSNSDFSFSCSPPQFPISKPPIDTSRVPSSSNFLKDGAKACELSPKDNSSKVSFNLNKLETPNLSMEPLKMKRRRKGGGYNLRKSMSWDKAFSTEEGVLNPTELSMISSRICDPCTEALPVISEEGESPSSSVSNHASRNVPSTPGCIRAGSKSGVFSRPMASFSIKRPVNVSSIRAAVKESKLPKLAASKPDCCSLTNATKSSILNASHYQQNQIARPAANVQKNVGLISSAKNITNAKMKRNTAPNHVPLPTKSSARHPKKNLVHSSGLLSSTNIRPPVVVKAIKGMEVVPEPVPSTTSVHSSDGQFDTKTVAVSLSAKTHVDGNVQCTMISTAKPSGLRMPSPSLGYFGAPKPSVSHCPSLRNIQINNNASSNSLGLRAFGELRSQHAQGRVKISNDVRPRGDEETNKQCLAPPAEAISCKTMKLNLAVNNEPGMEGEASFHDDIMSNMHKLHDSVDGDPKVQGYVELKEIEKVSCQVKEEEQKNDSEMLFDYEPFGQFTNDLKAANILSGSGDYSGNLLENPQFMPKHNSVSCDTSDFRDNKQHQEDKYQNLCSRDSAVIHKLEFGKVNSVQEQSVLRELKVEAIAEEQASTKKSSACKDAGVSQSENSVRTKTNKRELSIAAKIFNSGEAASLDFKDVLCTESELNVINSTSDLFQREQKQLEKEAVCKTGNSNSMSGAEETKSQVTQTVIFENSCSSTLSISAEQDQSLKVGNLNGKFVEEIEPQSPCLAHRFNTHPNLLMHLCDNVEVAISNCSKELKGEEVIESIKCPDVKNEDLNVSDVMHETVLGETQDGGIDLERKAERPSVMETQLVSAETNPLVVNLHCCDYTKCMCNVKVTGDINTMKCNSHLSKQFGLSDQSAEEFPNDRNLQELGVNGLKTDAILKEAEPNSSLDNSHEKWQRLETNSGNLFAEGKAIRESPTNHLENTGYPSTIIEGNSDQEFRAFIITPLIRDTQQESEGGGRSNSITDELNVEDAEVHCLGCNLAVVCSKRPTSELNDEHMTFVDCNEKLGEHSELSNSSIKDEKASQKSFQFHRKRHLLQGNNTCVEKSLEEDILHHAEIVQEQDDGCRQDLKSSVPWVSLTMEKNCVDEDQTDDHLDVEDAPSGSLCLVTSTEHHNDRNILHDMELSGQIVSSEIGSAWDGSECQGNTIDFTESGLEGESDLRFQIDQSSLIRSIEEGIGVHQLEDFSADGVENESNQNSDSFLVGMSQELENVRDISEDRDAKTLMMKPEDDSKKDLCMVKPPRNAVPFSDEWLAAVEAAGEEILTMKSGAVQNSPPDKSLPEPSPWSPVKQKNYQIGPFDCTKFTNIPPSDSF